MHDQAEILGPLDRAVAEHRAYVKDAEPAHLEKLAQQRIDRGPLLEGPNAGPPKDIVIDRDGEVQDSCSTESV